MLHFLKSNIYYSYELSNDITDEVWTTEFPACVNDADAEGIYEGVKLHKFDYLKDLKDNPKFLLDKRNIMFDVVSMEGFILSWYDSCAQRRAISNCVDIVQWLQDLRACYTLFYEKSNVYEGALGYYEALAKSLLDSCIPHPEPSYINRFNVLNAAPEVSWMLADYLHNNRRSVWNKYLTEYIRHNIRGMLYKGAIADRAFLHFNKLTLRLDEEMTIDDVDFSDEQAVYYFDNPYELDFHTNYFYIKRLCIEVDN